MLKPRLLITTPHSIPLTCANQTHAIPQTCVPTFARRFVDLYDTKLLARHLPAVFEGDTSLGQVYDAIVGGSRREQARVLAVAGA